MKRKRIDSDKLILLKQWDEVCEPFRKLKTAKEDNYNREVLEVRNRKTSSGYSKTKRGW